MLVSSTEEYLSTQQSGSTTDPHDPVNILWKHKWVHIHVLMVRSRKCSAY